jgi:hypothetical protein
MRFVKISLVITAVILLFAVPLFAQLYDPFNPEYDPDRDVLKPKEAAGHHVRTCRIYKDTSLYKTVMFHQNGHVLKTGYDYYFTTYDEKGLRVETFNFFQNQYMGHISYQHTPYGDPLETYEEQATSIGKFSKKMTYNYKNGLLANVFTEMINDMSYSLTNSTNNNIYHYDDQRNLIRINSYWGMTSYGMFGNEEDEGEDSYYYDHNRLVKEVYEGVEYKYYYDDMGKLTHVNEVNPDTGSWIKEITVDRYTYYDNGLLRTYQEGSFDAILWTYEYDYMDPAKFNLEIPEEYGQVYLWEYGTNADLQTCPITSNLVRAKVYIPDMALYVVQLTQNMRLPLILFPGKTVNMSASQTGINFAQSDTANMMILNIEKAIQQFFAILTQEAATAKTADHILTQMKSYPDIPTFLFYTQYWDLNNNKQVYLDYTERMMNKYPNNFKVNEVYAILRKPQ